MITKAANEVLETASRPGMMGRVWSHAGKLMFPGIAGLDIGMNVASGEKSLGESLGDNLGMWAGYELGSNWANKRWSDENLAKKNLPRVTKFSDILKKDRLAGEAKNFIYRRARGMLGVPLIASMAAGSVLGRAGDLILPWKRKSPSDDISSTHNTYA